MGAKMSPDTTTLDAKRESQNTESPIRRLATSPSIIRENEFDENGLVRTDDGPLVPAYVASQLGFNAAGTYFLDHIYRRLREEAGILPLCPFKACDEYLDFSRLKSAERIEELYSFWREFNHTLRHVNYELLMPRSLMLVAILDGGHAIDDGVAAEIGHYATQYPGRTIAAIRSDVRLAENPMSQINQAVAYFTDPSRYNGALFTGDDAYEKALVWARDTAARISGIR